jgi:putative ABC transport system ATP-binding protein
METIFTISDLSFLDFIAYPPLTIECGKATFICGESGCGKSTLLRLLNATLSPSSGQILYKGNSIASMNTITLRREVLLVAQAVYLFDGTIRENFEQFYNYCEKPCISEEKMKAYLLLSCADFSLNASCETMSGGERQRVFLAICISFLPEVLMLDEPTSALDEATSDRLFTQLKEFCKNNHITLITVCHNQNLTDTFADCIITLEKRA